MGTGGRSIPALGRLTPRTTLVLASAVLAISTAAILVRLAPELHPLAAAFWRNALVAGLLLPFVRPLARGDGWRTGLASLCLALHFWAWFTSLHHTTVLRSTVLVTLTPLWVGVLEGLFHRSWPRVPFWVGVGISVVGVSLMGQAGGEVSLLGDGLALLGGLLASVYFVLGRAVRQHTSIGAYGALVCGGAALWLLAIALVVGAPMLGFSGRTWGVLVAMALGPQLVGHMGLNYAVRTVPASRVASLVLLEPVGAAVLAALLFAEWPSVPELLGGVLTLVGIGFAQRG